jgi:Dolichyl-phosphate-mannose-protein mannosyltransferase
MPGEVDSPQAEREDHSILYSLSALWISFLFFLFGVRWLWERRLGGLLDIDESGYLGLAVHDYFSLSKHGVIGWIGAVIEPSVQGPIATAFASLVFAATGLNIISGFFVPLAFGTVTVFATYKLTEKISGPQAGIVASLLVAACPLLIIYSRSFHFAMPATAVMTLALYSAIRTARFSNLNWSIGFGIFLGLLPLARTMAIAFIPGMVFGAFLYAVSVSDARRERLGNFFVAIGASALTAATWLIFSGWYVAAYLLSFGYGSRAVEFGQERALVSIDTLRRLFQLVAFHVFVPHFLLIGIGLMCVLVVGWKAARGGARDFLRDMLQSPLIVLAATVGIGMIALVTSRNQGSAFVAPLLPPLIALAVCEAWAVSRSRLYHSIVALVGGVTAIVVALPFVGNLALLPAQKNVLFPFLGWVPVSDNRGTIQIYLDGNSPRPIGHDAASASLWWQLVKRTNAAIAAHGGPNPVIAQGFRHHVYNVNLIGLDHLISTGERWPLFFVEPIVSGDSPEGYRTWLTTGAAARANLLLTAPGDDGEFRPLVQTPALEEAARSLGFEPVQTWEMPNGRQVTLWRRNSP